MAGCVPLSKKEFQSWRDNDFSVVQEEANADAQERHKSQQLPSKYITQNTIGSALEEIFASFTNDCRVEIPADKSSIPVNIIDEFSLNQSIEFVEEQSVLNFYSFVFPEQSPEAFFLDPDCSRCSARPFVKLERFGFPVPVQDRTRKVHTQSCTGTLLAAAQFGVSLGIVNSQINADAQGEASNELTISSGKYESPLYTMLLGQPNDNWQRWVHFQLWRMYVANDSLRSIKNPQYLVRFNGMSSFRGKNATSNYNLSANLSAAGGIGGITGDGSFDGTFSRETRTAIEDYKLMINFRGKDTLDVEFGDLPTFDDLSKSLDSLRYQAFDDDGFYFTEGRSYHHTVHVEGAPVELCTSRDQWEFENSSGIDWSGRIESVTPTAARHPSTPESCVIEVFVTPGASFFDNAPETKDLDYILNYRAGGGSFALTQEQKALAFVVSIPRAEVNRDLVVKPANTSPIVPVGPTPTGIADQSQIRWNLNLALQELNPSVQQFSDTILNPEFVETNCPVLSRLLESSDLIPTVSSGSRELGHLPFSLTITVPTLNIVESDWVSSQICNMVFSVGFEPSGTDANMVERRVQFPVREPLYVPSVSEGDEEESETEGEGN
jgi:hypothetical protein